MPHRNADVPPTSRRALETLGLLSKKWHPVVVVTLQHHGPLGFNALLGAIPGISSKVLSGTLDALQDTGLVDRRVVSESPLRVEYDLTNAGCDMEPIFAALGEWGERHLESATPRVLLADADRRITDMYRGWLVDRYAVVRAHDGRELDVGFDDRVDVVLLDAALPGTDPREFVSAVRGECRTILLVGDRPGFDSLEADFDDVLRKPIVRETALEAIDEQLSRADDSDDGRELASLSARLSAFESVYSADRLAENVTYRTLRERLGALDDSVAE